MKVETVTERKPDVIITVSWEKAQALRSIVGAISGVGPGRQIVAAGKAAGHLGVTHRFVAIVGRLPSPGQVPNRAQDIPPINPCPGDDIVEERGPVIPQIVTHSIADLGDIVVPFVQLHLHVLRARYQP